MLPDRADLGSSAEARLNRELAITKELKTPVNFFVHTLGEVNDGLSQGRFLHRYRPRRDRALPE
jgi:hypothetical protein